MRLGLLVTAASLGTCLFGGSARAQQAQSGDEAMAESLFREAKALMEKGSFPEACPKLAESQRLDPGTGTLLALAFCHEKEGKVASAWAEYTNVRLAAERAGQPERVKVAGDRIAALEPKLPKLSVRVAAATQGLPGLEVKRDDVVLGEAAFGTLSPVDPGAHTIVASAPGHVSFETHLDLAPAEAREIEVPVLAREVVAPKPAPPPIVLREVTPAPRPVEDGSGRRTVGYLVGGAGIVAVGVGSVFGVMAIQKAGDANAACPNGHCTDPSALDENDQAKTAATISTVTIAVGAVAVVAGIYLVLSAPKGKPAATTAWAQRGFAW